jgi:hypothetical protein
MPDEKTIHDPVHGSMSVSGIVLDLLDTAEVQRLRGIRQLGLANIAFPGANHSRFEHALGVAYLARKVAARLELDKDDQNLLQAAAVLHDVGHAPYSHTLEHLMVDLLKGDHMELAGDIIRGRLGVGSDIEKKLKSLHMLRVYKVLKEWNVSAGEVSRILVGKHRRLYLGELLHSEVDVDQMDYLLRDSHYTGVALGMIDVDRLMRTLVINRGRLHILGKGVEAVEGLLTARGLMYSSVYYHHTVRVAEIMLENAVDRALEMSCSSAQDLFFMDDSQLLENLSATGGYPEEIVARIRYRQLFKTAYVETRRELTKAEKRKYIKRFSRWSAIREVQDEIADESGVERGHVILDVPIVDILISEPRLEKVEMPVLSDGKVFDLSEVSPIATALKRRQAPRYLIRVLTEPKNIRKVKRVAGKILG